MLNFDYDLTEDINFKLNLGNNIQDSYRTARSMGCSGLAVPGWYDIRNVSNVIQASNTNGAQLYDNLGFENNTIRQRSIAGFANLDLSFRDYLYLNSSFRIEESSVLSTTFDGEVHNKSYPYYSIGVSFIPTKAFSFFNDTFVNFIKIAPSYTRGGNTSAISPYETSEVGIIPSGYPYNTISGYGINPSQTNRNIKPEFVSTADLNVQLGFLKDRITLEGFVYQSDTENLITNANVSNTSGLNTLRDNVGKTRMRGFEVDLGLTPIKSAGIVWNIRASYAMSRSKVLELPEGVAEVNIYTPYTNRGIGVYAVLGEDFPILKGTTFQRDDQGRIIVDSNGTPLLSTELTNLGRVTPDYTLTLNTSVKFKGFTLSGSMDYRKGGVFSTLTKSLLTFTGAAEETGDFDRSQGYIVPNSVQLVNGGYVTNSTPVGGSASYANVANYFTSSTLQSLGEPTVIDATAFKVREISLSYDIPKNVLATTFVNSLTIGLYSRNPFIVYAKENRNYSDPETALSNGNGFGIAGTGQYPTQRSFGVNLKASF